MAIDCCCAISKQDQSFLLTGNSHVILQNDSHVNLEPSHVMFSHVILQYHSHVNFELSHVMSPHVVFSHVILQYYSHVNLEPSHVMFSRRSQKMREVSENLGKNKGKLYTKE